MLRYSIAVLVLLVLCVSCQKNVDSVEMRSPGEVAFKSNCQTCHILPKATMKDDHEWPQIVSRYGEKARLSETQKADIVAYLISKN